MCDSPQVLPWLQWLPVKVGGDPEAELEADPAASPMGIPLAQLLVKPEAMAHAHCLHLLLGVGACSLPAHAAVAALFACHLQSSPCHSELQQALPSPMLAHAVEEEIMPSDVCSHLSELQFSELQEVETWSRAAHTDEDDVMGRLVQHGELQLISRQEHGACPTMAQAAEGETFVLHPHCHLRLSELQWDQSCLMQIQLPCQAVWPHEERPMGFEVCWQLAQQLLRWREAVSPAACCSQGVESTAA